MDLAIRPVSPDEVDQVVALALRAWTPVHESMAAVLGGAVNHRVYPDWAGSQDSDVRAACADPETLVAVGVEGNDDVVGFVAVVIRVHEHEGEIDMIAVDPSAQ